MLGQSELSRSVARKAKSVARKDIYDIIAFVAELGLATEDENPSLDELAEDVCHICEEGDIDGLKFKIENKPIFKKRLVELLRLKSIYQSAKAYDLLLEHDNLLGSASILTDIRPIVDDRTTQNPEAVIIDYMLHLHYFHAHEKQHRDFYVALDETDIESLKLVIDKAEKRAEILKEILKKAKLEPLYKRRK